MFPPIKLLWNSWKQRCFLHSFSFKKFLNCIAYLFRKCCSLPSPPFLSSLSYVPLPLLLRWWFPTPLLLLPHHFQHPPPLEHHVSIVFGASSPIDVQQGTSLLHMCHRPWISPCMLFGWWLSLWELWGVWVIWYCWSFIGFHPVKLLQSLP